MISPLSFTVVNASRAFSSFSLLSFSCSRFLFSLSCSTFCSSGVTKVVPLDVLREMEKAGEFGELYHTFFTTTGTGTSTGSAAKFGTEIGQKLIDEHVDGVILVST